MKAWRYRFKLTKAGQTKESIFAIGEYSYAPPGETKEQAKARRDGRRFTLTEARDERIKARALVQQGINPAHIALTIRFGDKVGLASCDRWRLWKITQHDPGEIESFEALCDFLEWHRARVRGKAKDAAFLRWLMEREWNRLSSGTGYVDRS